jgi:hypothetical protein
VHYYYTDLVGGGIWSGDSLTFNTTARNYGTAINYSEATWPHGFNGFALLDWCTDDTLNNPWNFSDPVTIADLSTDNSFKLYAKWKQTLITYDFSAGNTTPVGWVANNGTLTDNAASGLDLIGGNDDGPYFPMGAALTTVPEDGFSIELTLSVDKASFASIEAATMTFGLNATGFPNNIGQMVLFKKTNNNFEVGSSNRYGADNISLRSVDSDHTFVITVTYKPDASGDTLYSVSIDDLTAGTSIGATSFAVLEYGGVPVSYANITDIGNLAFSDMGVANERLVTVYSLVFEIL